MEAIAVIAAFVLGFGAMWLRARYPKISVLISTLMQAIEDEKITTEELAEIRDVIREVLSDE